MKNYVQKNNIKESPLPTLCSFTVVVVDFALTSFSYFSLSSWKFYLPLHSQMAWSRKRNVQGLCHLLKSQVIKSSRDNWRWKKLISVPHRQNEKKKIIAAQSLFEALFPTKSHHPLIFPGKFFRMKLETLFLGK